MDGLKAKQVLQNLKFRFTLKLSNSHSQAEFTHLRSQDQFGRSGISSNVHKTVEQGQLNVDTDSFNQWNGHTPWRYHKMVDCCTNKYINAVHTEKAKTFNCTHCS